MFNSYKLVQDLSQVKMQFEKLYGYISRLIKLHLNYFRFGAMLRKLISPPPLHRLHDANFISPLRKILYSVLNEPTFPNKLAAEELFSRALSGESFHAKYNARKSILIAGNQQTICFRTSSALKPLSSDVKLVSIKFPFSLFAQQLFPLRPRSN